MQTNYSDSGVAAFMKSLASEAQREWVWSIIEVLKERYQDADHWSTSEDIRIGRKDKGRDRGEPAFFIQTGETGTPKTVSLSVNHLATVTGVRSLLPFHAAESLPEIREWFDQLELGAEGLKRLKGNGHVPADYP